jgi:hypothetical protein
MFNGSLIEEVQSLKCLGLIIDSTLSWELHIKSLAKICHFRIISLYKISEYVPYEYKLILGHALVISLMNYMSTIWSGASKKNIKVFEKVLRSLARFVTGIRKYERAGCHLQYATNSVGFSQKTCVP